MKSFSDLNIVNCNDSEKIVQHILTDWETRRAHMIVNFIYYSNFVNMHRDITYLEAMKLSDYILIDGIGMQLYFKVVKNMWPYNLNGTDLNPIILRQLGKREIPVALYGTTGKSITQAVKNISTYLNWQTIYHYQNGFGPLDWNAIVKGSALFIGMGSPRQEIWVRDHLGLIQEKQLLVITVGGFFDFASGFYVRAPKIIRKLKLEWAWRTMLHPKRHLKKRLMDLTILYKPFWDRIRNQGKFLNVSDI